MGLPQEQGLSATIWQAGFFRLAAMVVAFADSCGIKGISVFAMFYLSIQRLRHPKVQEAASTVNYISKAATSSNTDLQQLKI